MAVATIRRDLEDSRATLGRKVSVTVPMSWRGSPLPAALSSGVARGRQQLAGLLAGSRTTVEYFENAQGADFTVEGSLQSTWDGVWAVRSVAFSLVEGGLRDGGLEPQGFGPEDVAVLDLDQAPVERTLAPEDAWYDGGEGTNPDGTVNYNDVVRAGVREGLKNTGTAAGDLLRTVGEGIGSGVGGLFSGLGPAWTIVLLLVLAGLALLALAYVFGGPALLLGGA